MAISLRYDPQRFAALPVAQQGQVMADIWRKIRTKDALTLKDFLQAAGKALHPDNRRAIEQKGIRAFTSPLADPFNMYATLATIAQSINPNERC